MWLQYWMERVPNIFIVECSVTALLWGCEMLGTVGGTSPLLQALRGRGQEPPPHHLFRRAALMSASAGPVLGGWRQGGERDTFSYQRGSLKATARLNLFRFHRGTRAQRPTQPSRGLASVTPTAFPRVGACPCPGPLPEQSRPHVSAPGRAQGDLKEPVPWGPTSNAASFPAALAVGAVPVVLGAMGFTSTGIAASSIAAKMMSAAAIANGGGVASGSLVATLQSVGRCPEQEE